MHTAPATSTKLTACSLKGKTQGKKLTDHCFGGKEKSEGESDERINILSAPPLFSHLHYGG